MANPKPNQDQFLLQPNISHLILHSFVTIPHQDCSKTMTPLYHQFATNAQKPNPPNLAKPKPNQDQFFLQPNFSHLILHKFLTFPYQDCSKTMTPLFPQFCYQGTKSQSTQLCLAKTQPKSIPFATKLLTPHFGCICDNSLQDCLNTMTSFIHQFCYQHTKRQSTQLGYAKTQPRSTLFVTKLFTPHFAYICDSSPPRLLKNHDFTFLPILLPGHKKSIHPTWLSQNPTKINSFCNLSFHISFCIHL